ncbi:CC_3452 family protein [Hyphobacterium marinum]|uniref:C39 family peptidase n=1 Tax=Hyphobacterium marinum TaxID=3116574 RepID=A0ABU7LYB0_9PROT|nr:C39 family peptidase [Hyphobacterium sp. Y6023]MEE2566185.1 C39 family peptidase [Hyphobacterium sp. Y6023]
MRLFLIVLGFALSSPALAQTYSYTARTAAPAMETGAVQAGTLTWQCSGSACTISGPWPNPGVGACAQLAAQIGRITEYGHPGARLDAAGLARCNESDRAPRVTAVQGPDLSGTFRPSTSIRRPEIRPGVVPERPTVTAVTEMRYTAPRITSQTITVEPRPTERLFAIRDGGGDGDFGGNGPRVDLSVSLSAVDHCLYADIEMIAVETRPDHTRGRLDERRRIWCNPDGGAIERIASPTRVTANYTDTDWEIDTVVPGRGEIDVRRGLPDVDGPVRSFIVIGDTNGDIVSNDNDGRDVGDLDRHGNRTVSRTSVQVQFNPISLVVPIVEPAAPTPPSGSEFIWVHGQHSDFFVLPHTAGDAEFFGNGPRMSASSTLSLSGDRTQILATLIGSAEETGGDTRASGRVANEVIWTAPPGWQIDAVDVHYEWWDESDTWQDAWETALGRRAEVRFTDRDHEQDFLVEGAGEAARMPDSSTNFADSVTEARRRAMSHVAAFRAIGDTNGAEAGTRTGIQAFYRPLGVTLSRADPARARTEDLRPTVFLDVPTGDYANRLSGGNSCGPQAGSRVLRFYGVATTYEQFKRRVQSSGNFVSDQSLGTPPGTLRDRMNDLSSGFRHEVLPLGNARNNARALDTIRGHLDRGAPVIALISWGSQFARDIYSPHDAAATSHWVVVRGYNARNETFLIVDNGHPVEWSYTLFESLFDYGQDLQYEALLAAMNVEKGSIIVRR